MKKLIYILLMLFAWNACTTDVETGSTRTDLPVIRKEKGNHILHLSNKEASFWAVESRNTFTHWATGYVSHRSRIFGDYGFSIGGKKLDRSAAVIQYSPVSVQREYPSGEKETIFMMDGVDGLALQLDSLSAEHGSFEVFDIQISGEITRDNQQGYSVMVLPVSGSATVVVAIASSAEFVEWTQDSDRFSVQFSESNSLRIALGIGNGEEEAIRNALLLMTGNIDSKEQRLRTVFEKTHFETGDARLNQAWLWALASFDALNMDEKKTQMGRGIYAGYPWFQDYWGRDSFIALRALTVTGQFAEARAILESFLRYQIMEDTSNDYGKIPNRVRPDESIYNTADATPRFLIEADRYVAYSGDTAFARLIFPNLRAAVLGSGKYRIDEHGLLTHGPADTWMDAVGPRGPYSPRGNRALDIQALWIHGLQAASHLFEHTASADADSLAAESMRMRQKALEATIVMYRSGAESDTSDTPLLADALLADGSQQLEMRPNVFFAYTLFPGTAFRRQVADQASRMLGTPWGPMSLAENDPKFKPYHKAEPYYEQDASYHNGIVWLWNNGTWMESLIRHGRGEEAAKVIRNYVDLMLDNVTLGTLPELIDARARAGIFADEYPSEAEFVHISRQDQMGLRNEAGVSADVPSISGAWSQAWSLSEFIRNLTEDFGGLSYDVSRGFQLKPVIPYAWGNVFMTREFAGNTLEMRRMRGRDGDKWMFRFTGNGTPMQLPFQLPEMDEPVYLELSGKTDHYEISFRRGEVRFHRDTKKYVPKQIVE